MEAQLEYAHVACTLSRTLGTDLHARSALINKISALELSRKFIKSALLVGYPDVIFFWGGEGKISIKVNRISGFLQHVLAFLFFPLSLSLFPFPIPFVWVLFWGKKKKISLRVCENFCRSQNLFPPPKKIGGSEFVWPNRLPSPSLSVCQPLEASYFPPSCFSDFTLL